MPSNSDPFGDIEVRFRETVTSVWAHQVGQFQPAEAWTPPVNVYQLNGDFVVCVDLSGVEPESIEVTVSPGVLTIRGLRETPDPRVKSNQSMRIMSMEIDHGPFCRHVRLPDDVDIKSAATDYHKGLLWIRLPRPGGDRLKR